MKPLLLAALCVMSFTNVTPAAAQQTQQQFAMPQINRDELPRVFAVRAQVSDLARSERFYREALGATEVVHYTPRETIMNFRSGGSVNLHLGVPDAPPATNGTGFVLVVADMNAVMQRVESTGGSIVRPAGEVGSGVKVGIIRDPDGLMIELLEFPAG